ncbi:unnamed protein product [Polarella glacialis]|nr:unnamed protein product [Polarella glacialis]CAE8595295.1 unnamed protein product [Polarella glacialis]CAE8656353.1 unnamed protein product [Polarella glacialis]
MAVSRVIALCALFCGAAAFVPPLQQQGLQHQAPQAQPRLVAPAAATEATASVESTWSSLLLAGAGLGYAAAAVGAHRSQGRIAMCAEKMPTVRTPVAYPIFTFRWLAIHALAVPVVFFLGAISSMQFIQR